MISVDLLPRRYRNARALERFIGLAVIIIVACLLVISAIKQNLSVQTELLESETASLSQLALQYQTVNKRYKELEAVEVALEHRLGLAQPLLAQNDSILPYLNYFHGEIPERIWLTWLDVRLDGQAFIEGKALGYADVAGLIKWLEEDQNFVVSLEETGREESVVTFSLFTRAPARGEAVSSTEFSAD